MKKSILLIILISFTLASCITQQQRCERLTRLCGVSERVVTQVKDTTIYINKNIEVKLPGDTVKIDRIIPGKVADLSPATYKDGIITATACIAENRLKVFAFLNTPTLTINHRDTVYITKFRETTAKTTEIPVRYVPKYLKVSGWIVLLEVLALVLVILIKLKPGIFGIITSLLSKK